MKVVIDTNIWISFIISNNLNELEGKILIDEVIVYTCDRLLKEIFNVLKRQKFKKYIEKESIENLNFIQMSLCKKIEIEEKIKACRDKKDNFLLDLAVKGKVDYLISGDKDLQCLNPFRGIKIISLKEFEEILKG